MAAGNFSLSLWETEKLSHTRKALVKQSKATDLIDLMFICYIWQHTTKTQHDQNCHFQFRPTFLASLVLIFTDSESDLNFEVVVRYWGHKNFHQLKPMACSNELFYIFVFTTLMKFLHEIYIKVQFMATFLCNVFLGSNLVQS